MGMNFEGPNPFERPKTIERSMERERTLLARFRGRTTRWLAAAMLLLTSEGCAAAGAAGPRVEMVPAPSVAPKPGEDRPIFQDSSPTIPKDKLDEYRRANSLPVDETRKQPTMDDYLTSPDPEFGRRPLLGVDPQEVFKLTREYRRQKAEEDAKKREEAVRKQRRL